MVVDRIVVRPDIASRLADSFETALPVRQGIAIAEFADETAKRIIFSAKFACPVPASPSRRSSRGCSPSTTLMARAPNATGSAPSCSSSPTSWCPTRISSLARGAIAPWARTSASSPYYQQTLESLARAYRQPMTKPWKDLPKAFRDVILYGSGEDEITFTYDDGVRHYSTTKPFEGVINNIERRWRETESAWVTRGAVALPVGPALRGVQAAIASSRRRWR